jgi:asparagine synthetase B (glutamine-hydrolysing)
MPSKPEMIKTKELFGLPQFFLGQPAGRLSAAELQRGVGLGSARLCGQFSYLLEDGPCVLLVRDRLGINKLFYHFDEASRVLTAGNSLYEVASRTVDVNRVLSVPPGHYLSLHRETGERHLRCYYDISTTREEASGGFDPEKFRLRLRATLEGIFQELNRNFPGHLFVVCLSGGLDSTIVAYFARKFLGNVMAATFSYGTPENGMRSDDFNAAEKIAKALDLKFFPVLAERRLSLELLDRVLIACQDWRDFNVHCAWLNNLLGEGVAKGFPGEKIIFLTGDMMNEFVADYKPVQYKETSYYPQPRLSKDRLRRFFVYGLDTSDREIGVFHRHGIATVQPYSAVAEDYLSVPGEIIQRHDCKEYLNLPLLGNSRVADLVVKTKVRAQEGGKDGGTLGLFHDNGLTQEKLKERWENLFAPLVARSEPLGPVIVSGRYRS